MELTENKIIKSQKKIVWSALMSSEVLSQCIPGCQQMTGNPQDGFEATVVQKVGPVKATFKGKVTLSDILLEESLKLSGEGKEVQPVLLKEKRPLIYRKITTSPPYLIQ